MHFNGCRFGCSVTCRGPWKRGDRAVFADPSGDYLQRFYDPCRGDVILNPFDSRSARWDPFGEFSERFEIDQLGRSLIPAEDEWSGYALTFVSAAIARCADAGRPGPRRGLAADRHRPKP